jgi:dienelactone hydrolase
MFHSEKDGDKAVEIFAYFSYPKGARQLPAFIWNQGGLAQASPYWTTFGAKRGYAALCIDFPMPGYRSTGGYPIVSGLELTDDPQKAPIYHGAVALLRAVSYLESRPEVDRQRIGMAGSSWGGFYTTLMVGVDPRLKVGSCLFGCGGLDVGNLWWDGQGRDLKRDAAFRKRWAETLDPAGRLGKTKTPIGWFTGTNDQFYWMPALMKSYRQAGHKHLSLLPNFNHALTPALDEQVFAWLDVHLQGKPGFLQVGDVTVRGDGKDWEPVWTFKGPRKVVKAELLFSPGKAGNWASRPWLTVPAKFNANTGACTAPGPVGAVDGFCCGTVIDSDGFRYSTPLYPLQLPAAKDKPPLTAWDYDGCAMWGGWEETHVNYLRLHGLDVPPLSKEAKEGQNAAVLKAGKTTLPPILFTCGVRHRVSCWLKADKAADVVLTVGLTADGKGFAPSKVVKVGAQWTEAEVEFEPPAALSASARLVIETPAGATVLLNAVRCRPVLKGNSP